MAVVERGDMASWSPLPGWTGRIFHSEHMTFAQWEIEAGAAELHEHHHPQEEVWNVVSGEIVIILGGEERRIGAGDAAVVPPNTPHAVRITGPCRAIVADNPRRVPEPRRTPTS